MHVNPILHGLKSKLIGSAMHMTAFDAATRHPRSEPIVVVIAPIDLACIRACLWQLHCWRPPELAAAQYECIIQHTALFQIRQ